MQSVKNVIRISCLVSSLFMALSACQPKDIDLKTASLNAKAQSDTTADVEMKPVEKNKLVALLIEKSFEPLHLLKAKSNSEYAQKQGLNVKINEKKISENGEFQEEIIETVIPLSNDVAVTNSIKATNTTVNLSYKIVEYSLDPTSGKLLKFVIIKNNSAETKSVSLKVSEKNPKYTDDFNSETTAEYISISAGTEDNTYFIKTSRSETTNSKFDKKTYLTTESKLKISWDGQKSTLDQAIKVLSIDIDATRKVSKTAAIHFIDLAPELAVELGQNCVSINGKIQLNIIDKNNQKITNPDTLVISDSSMSFVKFQSAAAACEKRAVVDYGRML